MSVLQFIIAASLSVSHASLLLTRMPLESHKEQRLDARTESASGPYLASSKQHVDKGRSDEFNKQPQLEAERMERAERNKTTLVCEEARDCAKDLPYCVELCQNQIDRGASLIPAYCQRVLILAAHKGGKYIYKDLDDSDGDRQDKYISQLYTSYCKLPPVSPLEMECFTGTPFTGDPDFPTLSWTPSSPGMNCFPVRYPFCTDNLATGSCHPVVNLPLQYGCGGVRGRMNCDEKEGVISAGRTDPEQRRPSLIAVD